MINPYERLAFILSLKELSQLGSFDERRLWDVFISTVFEELYVDLELGRDGARWSVASGFLGLHEREVATAAEMGHEITSLCLEFQDDGWSSSLCEKFKLSKLPTLADGLWKELISCKGP